MSPFKDESNSTGSIEALEFAKRKTCSSYSIFIILEEVEAGKNHQSDPHINLSYDSFIT